MPTATSAAAIVITKIAIMTPVSGPSAGGRRAVPPEGDEVDVGRVEHDLDRHQHGDRVAPDQDADQADRRTRPRRSRGTSSAGCRCSSAVPLAGQSQRRGCGAWRLGAAAGPLPAVAVRPICAADLGGLTPRGGRRCSSSPSRWARAIAPTSAAVRSRPATSKGTAKRVIISLPTVLPMLLIAVGPGRIGGLSSSA